MSEKMTNKEIAKQAAYSICGDSSTAHVSEIKYTILQAITDAEARVHEQYKPLVEAATKIHGLLVMGGREGLVIGELDQVLAQLKEVKQ